MKNVKIKDLRQGVTLYYVMAFPLESKGGNATVQPYSIQSRAYLKPLSGKGILRSVLADALWFKETHPRAYRWWHDTKPNKPLVSTHSVRDSGIAVGKTNYNFHRMFHTQKQAQRYADRMNSGCLTHEERLHALEMIERDQMFAAFDTYWDDRY